MLSNPTFTIFCCKNLNLLDVILLLLETYSCAKENKIFQIAKGFLKKINKYAFFCVFSCLFVSHFNYKINKLANIWKQKGVKRIKKK